MFDNNSVSDVQYLKPAERIEGNEFVKMEKDNKPDSKTFRATSFYFVGANGEQFKHTEFAPNRTIKGNPIKDEDFKKNIGMSHSRVAHISRAFLSEDTFKKIIVPGMPLDEAIRTQNWAAIDEAWDGYIRMTAQALQVGADGVPAVAKGQKCALKIVYDKAGKYGVFPKIPAFISTANHHKVFTTDPQWDKYVAASARPDAPLATGAVSGFSTPAAGQPASGFNAPAANQPPQGGFQAPSGSSSGF